jgi:hypothetical protein
MRPSRTKFISVEREFQEWEVWWARQDSNLGPTDYESAALTD